MSCSLERSRRLHRSLRSLLLVAFPVLLLFSTACKPSTPPPGSEGPARVRLQLNWVPEPQFGGIYEARRLGLLETDSLAVDVRPGSGGISAPQLVATGEVEFGIVGGSQILQINQEGGELVALFAVYQHDPHAIMVPEGSPFQTIEQLWQSPQATIGAESSLAFIRALNEQFSASEQARFVAYNLPAFRAGRQSASQCFMTAEPVTLELEGFRTRVFSAAKASGFDPYNTVLVTRRSYLDSNPEVCREMVDAFTRGWTSYTRTPEKTNQLLSELNPAMSLEAMNLTAKRQLPLILDAQTDALGIGCMTSDRWTSIAERLVALRLLDRVPDVEALYRWPFGAQPSSEDTD
ncbi:MAG: ABC transporter substrate-binding protein [Planctomycetota bacterium]|nr:ABC transporter substrate-binding protein [Planctomycetota bacterium]